MSSKQTQMARLQAAMRDCKEPISFFILSLFAKLVIALHFKKVDIRGKENLPASGPYICIANHSSRWDGPTLGRIIDRPANFMVSPNELQGLQGFLLSRVGAFPAHPKLDFVSHVMQQFKKGEPFVIFPEGNVFYDGHTHPFKKGIARIAFAAHQNNIEVPIVPVGITYESGVAHYNIGTPVSIEDYAADLQINPVAASKRLTTSLHREVCYLRSELGCLADRRQLELVEENHFMPVGTAVIPAEKPVIAAGGADLMVTESLNVPTICPASSKAATCT
ncbi:MAG: lysophospholipid acyltransferase family protein [Candidatus Melainabacteria bacterium]|nr:lysophospholipid acyltransferase family protein [Candidatus Melainabacteria bacterium]